MFLHLDDRPLWSVPVYVMADRLSIMRAHIPGHGTEWLNVHQCPGLRAIRPGCMGEIHMPDWLRQEKRIAPGRWVRRVD